MIIKSNRPTVDFANCAIELLNFVAFYAPMSLISFSKLNKVKRFLFLFKPLKNIVIFPPVNNRNNISLFPTSVIIYRFTEDQDYWQSVAQVLHSHRVWLESTRRRLRPSSRQQNVKIHRRTKSDIGVHTAVAAY